MPKINAATVVESAEFFRECLVIFIRTFFFSEIKLLVFTQLQIKFRDEVSDSFGNIEISSRNIVRRSRIAVGWQALLSQPPLPGDSRVGTCLALLYG